MCNSWGDPHVDGFDGARNDVYDANWYTLVEPTAEAQENDGVPYFRVSQDLIRIYCRISGFFKNQLNVFISVQSVRMNIDMLHLLILADFSGIAGMDSQNLM